MTPSPLPRTSRLTRARTFAHGALAGGVGVIIAIVVFLVATLGAWISVDTHRALTTAMGESEAATLTLQTRIGEDPAAQDSAATSLITSALGNGVDIERLTTGEGDSARVQYVVTPNAERLTPESVGQIASGITTLEDRFRTSDASVGGLTASGSLGETIADAQVGAASAAAIAPIPLAIIGVLGWFAVMELSRSWGRARGRETALLTARGLSRWQKFALAASEVSLITLVASAVGVAGAVAVMWARAGEAGLKALAGGAPIVVGAIAVLGITAGVAVARAAEGEATVSARAARLTRAASVGGLFLVIVAAGVLLWQLIATQDAPTNSPWRVALSSLAPILALIAAALIAVLIASPLAQWFAALTTKRASLSPTYPARQVARRLPAYATAVALTVITVSGAVFAAGYVSTWERASETASSLSAGAEVRASGRVINGTDMADARSMGTAAGAYTADIVVGETPAQFVALSQNQMTSVLIPVEGLVDPKGIHDDLAVETNVLPVAEGAQKLRIEYRAQGLGFAVSTVMGQIWVIDDAGVATPLQIRVAIDEVIATEPDPNGGFYGDKITAMVSGEAVMPAGTTGIVGIGFTATDLRFLDGGLVTLSQIAVSTLDNAGSATPVDVPNATSMPTLGGSSDEGPLKIHVNLWTSAGTTKTPVPAIVTRDFATELDLKTDTVFDVRVAGTGRDFNLVVKGIVDSVPGTTSASGVMVSLDALVTAGALEGTFTEVPSGLVLPNEIWFADAKPGEVADKLNMTVDVPTDIAAVVTGGLITTWWVAPIGAALLAAVALIAMLASVTSTRAGEVLILRTVGVAPRKQARMRIVEAVTVVVIAAILGAIAGWGIGWVVLPVLVGAAVPGSKQLAFSGLTPGILLVVIVTLVAALLVAAVVMTNMVKAQGKKTRIAEAAE